MLIAIAAISAFGAVMSIVLSMFSGPRRVSMESRIQDFRSRTASLDDDPVDLELPFAERVLRPSIENFSHAISSILPASVLADIQKQLVMAGNTMTLQASSHSGPSSSPRSAGSGSSSSSYFPATS